jgi:hypothetical protein
MLHQIAGHRERPALVPPHWTGREVPGKNDEEKQYKQGGNEHTENRYPGDLFMFSGKADRFHDYSMVYTVTI